MIQFITELKKKLKEPLPGTSAHRKLYPEYRKTIFDKNDMTLAGVMLLIFPDSSGNLLLPFIKRPPNTGPHSSQVSFPGGKYEESDLDLMKTALRETDEEIGTNSSEIEIVGKLTKLYIPVSKYLVHPYIGYTNKTPTFLLDKKEVDYLITFPVNDLVNLNIKNKTMTFENKNYEIPYYDINNEVVWGATSMILSEFIEVMKKAL